MKRFVVNHLKVTGYDAGVCKSKWLSSGRVPGGTVFHILIVKWDSKGGKSMGWNFMLM